MRPGPLIRPLSTSFWIRARLKAHPSQGTPAQLPAQFPSWTSALRGSPSALPPTAAHGIPCGSPNVWLLPDADHPQESFPPEFCLSLTRGFSSFPCEPGCLSDEGVTLFFFVGVPLLLPSLWGLGFFSDASCRQPVSLLAPCQGPRASESLKVNIVLCPQYLASLDPERKTNG